MMTMDFQTWMRMVWASVTEPAEMAGKVLTLRFPREALWTALVLAAVLHVLSLGLLQLVSPQTAALQEQIVILSPFAYFVLMGTFLTFLIFMLVHAGRMMGGIGTIESALALLVWLQAVSLTLEAIQILLMLLSPFVAGVFSLLSVGAIVWVFVNLINVLHGFGNLGKAIVVMAMALIGTALGTVVVVGMFGITPTGGTL